ncbi:MAG: BON domain-containing protein [Gammaproteobacteria bacterium]
MNKYAIAGMLAASSLATMQAFGIEHEGAAKDAWIDGKLETVFALNRYLRAYTIDTDVTKGIVVLTGKVGSDIDKSLAGEIAKGVVGVVEVDNHLVIAPQPPATAKASTNANEPGSVTAVADPNRSFGVWIDDVTTTASVKTKLLANKNTEGLKISVETRGDVVTLSGQVKSAEEKSLAEQVARNTGDVKDVRNQLVVAKAN